VGNEQVVIDLYLDLMRKALTASIYDESAWRLIECSSLPKLSSLRKPVPLSRAILKYILSSIFKKISISLVKANVFDAQVRDKGQDWPLFGYTMCGHRRLENVRMCVEDVLRNRVPGDLIETGAWRGGTTIFMRAILKAYGVLDYA
jgi:hypothetical protein